MIQQYYCNNIGIDINHRDTRNNSNITECTTYFMMRIDLTLAFIKSHSIGSVAIMYCNATNNKFKFFELLTKTDLSLYY